MRYQKWMTSALVLVLGTGSVPGALYAQQAEEELTPEEIDEAVEELERDGFEAFGSQEWGEALLRWSQVLGYRPERTHLLYFSAQAFFKKGDLGSARRFALRARSATPPLKAELAKKNEELLVEIARIEGEQAEKKRAELEEKQRQDAQQRQIAEAVRPRASGWIWVGTGALALGGASMGGAAWQSDKLEDVREKMKVPQTRSKYDLLADEASGHRTLGQVFFWSSVALIGTGVGIIIWDLMTPEDVEPDQGVAPAAGVGLSPNGAFVRITW